MKTKLFLSSLLVMLFSISYSQFDIPPGGIPGFPPDNNGCPPGAWCHPDGAGMSFISNSDIDAVNDALENPEGCCCACALGKWFFDVIKGGYPDCYPNCNLEEDSGSSEGASTQSYVNNAASFASKGEISGETYNYFKNVLPKNWAKSEGKAVAIKGLKESKFKLHGMWVYNAKKKNEFHVLCIEPVDLKSGISYDRLYLVFDQKNMVIMNHSWIEAKKKKNKKKK